MGNTPGKNKKSPKSSSILDYIVNGVMGDNWLGGESGSLKKLQTVVSSSEVF